MVVTEVVCSFRCVFHFRSRIHSHDRSFGQTLAPKGIMEGANLSGDLRNPNRDIGRGTISAVFAAITTYMFLIFGFAGSVPRETLRTNMNVMANIAWPSKYVIVMGVSVSSFSSALGSVFGGSRVLQALGRDDLPPEWGLRVFAKGSIKGDEPRRAVLFTWFLAQCACLVGDLDVISPIISSFFLLSYGTVNLTCFLMDISGTPNFRPQFRHYSRKQSFLGFLLCMGMLFFLDVWYGVAACTFMIVLCLYISYKAPAKAWGDVSQSIMYHQVRKYLLRLDVKDHPKNWRPSLLLLLGPSKLNMRVIDFCNSMKKGGLYSIGDVVIGDVDSAGRDAISLRENWLQLVKELNLKAIPEVTFGPTVRTAFQQLVVLVGLGGMKPNCVALMLPNSFGKVERMSESQRESRHSLLLREDSGVAPGQDESAEDTTVFESESEFMDVLRDIVKVFQQNLLLACNFDHQYRQYSERDTVDVWMIGPDLALPPLSLQLQLAHIQRLERGDKLRLLNIVDESCDVDAQHEKLQDLAEKARLFGATCHVHASRGLKPLSELFQPSEKTALEDVNRVIVCNSQNCTRVSFIRLPSVISGKSADSDESYIRAVKTLVRGIPPVLLVQSGRRDNLISADI